MNKPQHISSDETFLSFLEKVFLERKSNNSAYSIRAFARDLDLDQSLLSKFLRGKTDFNWKTIDHCLSQLSVSEEIFEHFRTIKHNFTSNFTALEDSIMNDLACWKYWAILEYFKIDKSPSFDSIARSLRIETDEVKKFVDSLIRFGFLENQDGIFKILKPNNSWLDNEKTTLAKKTLQKNLTTKSCLSIDEVPVDHRHHCSLTVAVDSKRLPDFKKKLNALLVEFGKYSQKNNEVDQVYQLTLGFFPLTTLEQE